MNFYQKVFFRKIKKIKYVLFLLAIALTEPDVAKASDSAVAIWQENIQIQGTVRSSSDQTPSVEATKKQLGTKVYRVHTRAMNRNSIMHQVRRTAT